ncbi:MAG: hypothetical protein AB1571_02155 [Nanoarchaeota archaeon]
MKTKAILMALFLVMSVFTVFAQEDTQTTGDVGGTEITEDLGEPATTEPAQVVPIPQPIPLRERIKIARQSYIEIRQNYIGARQKFLDQRRIFITSKEKLVNCRGDFSERCKSVRADIRSNAKPFLLNSADMVLKLLDNLEARISNSNMTDEEKSNLLADIDAKIKEVEDAKAKIEGLTKNSTNEEIKEAANVIRTAWIDTRKDVKRVTGHFINFRIGEIIVRAERLEVRFDKVVEKAKADGKDTAQLESLISQFKEKIEEAKEKYNLAKGKYIEAKTAGDVDAVIREANQYLKDAHSKLKEAQSILKSIVQEIRKQGQEKTLEETTATEPAQQETTETA